MSPREVGGLQQLAKSQGGSLSVNPNTGLVEAGFLEQALPIVAAAAATYFTAGAAAPALSAALGSTMAGGILAGAGAGALIGGGSAAIQGKDSGQGALYGGLGGAIAGGTGAYDSTGSLFSGASSTPTPTPDASGVVPTPAPTPTITNTPTPAELNQLRAPVTDAAYNQALNATPGGTATQQMATPQQVADIKGFTQGMQPTTGAPTPGSQFYSESNPLTKAGLLALPGLGAAAGDKTNMPGGQQYDENSLYRMRLSKDFQGSTPVRPNPYYKADYSGYAGGGMVAMAPGGLAQIQNTMFPQSQQVNTQFATPTQMPTSAEVIRSDYEPVEDPYTGQPSHFEGGGSVKKKKPTLTSAAKLKAMDPYEAAIAGLGNAEYGAQMPSSGVEALKPKMQLGQLNLARGGISDLGGYSDGGRMLKGRGDGMSDSIPATIGNKQPARLADGEFVVPADVVSHLGNGSTDAGAKRLYAMMDKVRQARTGKKKQAPAVNPKRLMPA
jgi:hypothetical protein